MTQSGSDLEKQLKANKKTYKELSKKFLRVKENAELRVNNSKIMKHKYNPVGSNDSNDSDDKNEFSLGNQQSLKLENAKREIIDIEARGNDIGKELHFQTIKMQNVNENTVKMNKELGTSNSLLRGMMKRENRNKIMIGVFSFAFVLLFVFIFILK